MPAGGGSSESEGECGGARARAQYVSANCVVFTHYSGDVAAVVDEHFTRALALDKPKGKRTVHYLLPYLRTTDLAWLLYKQQTSHAKRTPLMFPLVSVV